MYTINITVFKTALVIEGVEDDKKEDPGAFFQLNAVKTLKLSSIPEGVTTALADAGRTCSISLTKTENGDGSISLWKDSGCETEIANTTWDLNDSSNDFQETIYAMGDVGSSDAQDIKLELKLTVDGTEYTDTAKATVVGLNIAMQELENDQKESIGAFIALEPVRDDSGKITSYSSPLVKADLTVAPIRVPAGYTGKLKMEATDNIFVWSDENRTEELTDKEWDLSSETVPDTVYVEGDTTSDSVRSDYIKLTLELYTSDNAETPAMTLEDKVAITAFTMNLSVEDTDESYKLNPGAFIKLNPQDKVAVTNTEDDSEDSEEDSNSETNLEKVTLDTYPSGVITDFQKLKKGTLSLVKTTSGSGNLKFWTSSDKKEEITELVWNMSDSDVTPITTFYAEGVTASSTAKDIELKLKLEIDEVKTDDIVNVTVINLDMDIAAPTSEGGDIVREEEDDSKGLFFKLNNDHDDGIAAADCDDNVVNGEKDTEDMARLILRKLPSTIPDEIQLTLERDDSSGEMRVFMPDKNSQNGYKMILDTQNQSTVSDSDAAILFTAIKNDDFTLFVEGAKDGEVQFLEKLTNGSKTVQKTAVKAQTGDIILEPITTEGGVPPYNPAAVVLGQTAYFHLETGVEASKIKWVPDNSNIKIVGSDTGKTITVEGVSAGSTTFEIQITGNSGADAPRISTVVIAERIVKVNAYIVCDKKGNIYPTTEEDLLSKMESVNNYFKQLGIKFETTVNFIDDNKFLDLSLSQQYSNTRYFQKCGEEALFRELIASKPNGAWINLFVVNKMITPSMLGGTVQHSAVVQKPIVSKIIAHEIGHALGLDDIYNDGVKVDMDSKYIVKDWSEYYSPSLTYPELLQRLIMYGYNSQNGKFLNARDFSTGEVYGYKKIGKVCAYGYAKVGLDSIILP